MDLLAGFVRELRRAGLPVSLTENIDAAEALRHVPMDDREAFKHALGATLVKSNAHWRTFEAVFEVYFSPRGPAPEASCRDEPPPVGGSSRHEQAEPSASTPTRRSGHAKSSRKTREPTIN